MNQELRNFLAENRLISAGEAIICTALTGGVSCDVWRVDASARALCVKQALPRLRVAALWEAPVSRSTHEWQWMKFASAILPDSIPRLLAHDPVRAMLATEFLDPAEFPVWKQLLLHGEARAETAISVAAILARLHAASSQNKEIAAEFDTSDAFYALRIEPYLLEAARRNPDVADVVHRLAETTLGARIALVHGDYSPKNILVGPRGPVILDAETAWYGDPAFDVAFCLNHLLLKCLARPILRDNYLACFAAFAAHYLSQVSWEAPADFERRTSDLLPALLLARVDGKSPVEYLEQIDRDFVREVSCRWLAEPTKDLQHLARLWREALATRQANAR
jgi:5-methylthioribose kinase